MDKSIKRNGITKVLLWKRYREIHPNGYGLSRFKHYYLLWYRLNDPVLYIEHKGGEEMYGDFTREKLRIMDPLTGEIEDLEVFILVIGAGSLPMWKQAEIK